jgi:hypothetical protein
MIAAIAAAIVVAVGGWMAVRATARPRIMVSNPAVDFGPIAERETIRLEVRNMGRAPLRVLALTTSCGCTKAQIGASVIAAGGAEGLSITFDPVAHGPQTGPARHTVYIRTNDAHAPESEIEVRAVVLKHPSP